MDNKNNTQQKEKAFSSIGAKSFITVVLILVGAMLLSGILSYFIPQGSFLKDESGAIIEGTYTRGEVDGIAPWRVLTAPFRVFASEDALTVIMISVFLLVMSGVFNVLDKTGGTRVVISHLIRRLKDKGGPVVCLCTLIFMLFGSFFGMFEELVTLVPIIVMFMLSMGMDTMTGLGACMLAACFGFSAAITNPFSVGLAAQIAGTSVSDGVWLRIIFFGLIYLSVCIFLMMHLKKIEKNPKLSPSFESDLERRSEAAEAIKSNLDEATERKLYKSWGIFFVVQLVLLVAIATIRYISDLAIPILAVSFLVGGIICGTLTESKKSDTFRHLGAGAFAMLPAVALIALASSVKLIMTESGIIDTIMHAVIESLEGKGPFVSVLLIFLLILILQVFIGSASAKIMLVMPIIMPIAGSLGISPATVIIAYCMADGFTDVILPTNPVLLVGLSMANVSYGKWVKWTWKLQLIILALSVGILGFATLISY